VALDAGLRNGVAASAAPPARTERRVGREEVIRMIVVFPLSVLMKTFLQLQSWCGGPPD